MPTEALAPSLLGVAGVAVLLLGVTVVGAGRPQVAHWCRSRARRSRAVVALLLFIVIFIEAATVGEVVNLVVAMPLLGLAGRSGGFASSGLAQEPGLAAAALVTTAIVSSRTGSVALRNLGFTRSGIVLSDIVLGALLGPLLFAGILVTCLAFGWADVALRGGAGRALATVATGLLLFITVGIAEEAVFRGFLLTTVAQGFGLPAGVVVSTLLFALAHSANPGSGLIPVGGILVAGLLFAYAYLLTGRLWLPVAFHTSWDWSETTLFGYPDSGIPPDSIVRLHLHGPAMWLGGAFGPEAGLFGVLAMAIAAGVIAAYGAHRRLAVGLRSET